MTRVPDPACLRWSLRNPNRGHKPHCKCVGFMKYDQISPVMRAFIGTHEGFRKLGFPAENLFFLCARDGVRFRGLSGFLMLEWQKKIFSVELGPIESEESIHREYEIVCDQMTQIPESDLQRMWNECEMCQNKIGLLLALRGKGIEPPIGEFS